MNLTRKKFLKFIGAGIPFLLWNPEFISAQNTPKKYPFLKNWTNPPREFSQAPFWFWNDDLSEAEIARQLQDFCEHGVYGFVIHPRVGLPKDIGWMSEKMIYFMRFAIQEAARKQMWVVLYDEGMYPSGAASGQVVAENPAYRPRGLFAIDLDETKPGEEKSGFRLDQNGEIMLAEDQKLITIVKRRTNQHRIAILERFIQPGYSLIRGLHFLAENPSRREDKKEVAEEMPPLADILNPEAMNCFIKLVYQRYFDEFGEYFGKTIKAIFTDEPSYFGKRAEKGAIPGNALVLNFVNEFLKENFSVFLPALWYDDEPGAEIIRKKYYQALKARLEETYYQPISKWCQAHQIALTGHPADPDDIGQLRYFQMPGQDIVWRYIEPNKPSALEGSQSTQAKCASSAMIHLGRRRNSNEYCGAYGHNFSFEEMKWLANWLLIRGCNLLYPHAFYYSVRGPRIDERPPDVGPNNSWWDQFKPFADATSRLCWLNTDSQHICEVAILGLNDYLPWKAAKVLFQNQIDFNYLEARHLWEDANVTSGGIFLAGMNYRALIIEIEPPQRANPAIKKLEQSGRIIYWQENMAVEQFLSAVENLITKDITLKPENPDIRIRHVKKDSYHWYLLFNEGEQAFSAEIEFAVKGPVFLMDTVSSKMERIKQPRLTIPAHQLIVLMIDESE